MLTTMVFDPTDRLRSFELVAALARTPSAARSLKNNEITVCRNAFVPPTS